MAEFPAEGGVQLALDGELDHMTTPLLGAALKRASPKLRITIDFSRCSFIAADGVRMLIRAAFSPERSQHKLRIVGLHGQPRRVFVASLARIEHFEVDAHA